MRTRLVAAAAALTTIAAGGGAAVAATSAAPSLIADPTAYVDPMVGTSGDGFTVPGATTPFGMTMVSPDTTGPVAYTGYSYTDATIRGFSLVHISAAGVPIGGDLPFLPVTTPVADPSDPTTFAVGFSHGTEHASAGAYSVGLANGVSVDLAATPHGGLERFTPAPGTAVSVLADTGRNAAGLTMSSVQALAPNRLEGSSLVHWRGGDYTVYYSARFSVPFTAVQTYVGSTVSGNRSAKGTDAGAMLGFPAGTPVTMAVGVSFVDVAGARANLAAEIPAYDVAAAQRASRAGWRRELSKVLVGGGTAAQLRTFYTALYHAMLAPDVDSDVDGRYAGPDRRVHAVAKGHRHYEDFSLWDTIRGENALLATLEPARYTDMVASLADFAQQDGDTLPRWSLHDTHPDYMNGDPAIPTIAEAICRGLPVNNATLYGLMHHLAFDLRPASYLQRGWIPGSASDTLEYADADFALALVADRLGHSKDAGTLAQRGQNWRHLYHDGWLQPRAADGSWPANYDPKQSTGYREGTGWQYLWLAPQDEGGLAKRYDADGAGYASRLDHLFSAPASTAVPGAPVVPTAQYAETLFGLYFYGDLYVPGNEHDLEAPYLYDWAGQPAKTQAVITTERAAFSDSPLGLPGNDDLGGLSGWYVWAALGFAPVIPGAPVYVIGSPMFPREVIDVGGRRPFTVDAPSAATGAPYIAAGTLNGRPLNRTWFTVAALHSGGSVHFAMSSTPTTWASAPSDAPPSLSESHGSGSALSAFGCEDSA